ncbi:MAG TPA: tRNA lysidine(34) synthetase TilS [Acidimicrobiales bacterium]|nr:tRNA lysidine(34) synthetase TilS [Acidimicrobiales bacterium]
MTTTGAALAGLDGYLPRCRFPGPADGPVALAVSGGPDSLALLVLGAAAGLSGTAVHVDHGLRPGSESEADVVADAARRWGFAFSAVRVHVDEGPDLEARARRARYGALPRGALTGHTMDDQAETVLLNLMRGAGVDGLSGMRRSEAGPAGVSRPLLGLRRHDTEEVCRRAGLVPVRDPSNADPRFRRNRVRAELIPLLERIAGREVVPILARQAEVVAADAELLDRLAQGLDPTEVATMRAVPRPLAHRAVRAWLRAGPGHHPPSAAEVDRVMEVVEGRAVACEVSGGRRVARRAGRLTILPAQPHREEEAP